MKTIKNNLAFILIAGAVAIYLTCSIYQAVINLFNNDFYLNI